MRVALLLLAALALAALDLDAAAAHLDRLIDADLAERKLRPEPACDDPAFVRRAWLDLGGRIPTAAEAAAFLADHDPGRRARLIRRIVATPAWEMAQFAWFADLLRVQSRLQDRHPGQGWIDWLWQAVHEDRAWDRLVAEMLTASGDVYAAAGGATGFTMRDAGMPLDHAAITAQTFLGTRIGCAQCHDHPFDSWTRLDFLRFAAFSADARTVLASRNQRGMKELLADASPQVRNTARTVSAIAGAHVDAPTKAWLPVPDDYQYQDAKKGDHIAAATLFAPSAPAPAGGDPRQVLATWLTGVDNPRFALAIGNRLWKRLFGTGLVEPVDDLRGDPAAPPPTLQAAMAQLVRDAHFDLREVEIALCLTRHWQRRQWGGTVPPGGGITPGRPVQRLDADAWWDSLVTLASEQPDVRNQLSAEPLSRLHDELAKADAKVLVAAAERLVAANRKDAPPDPEMSAVSEVLRAAPKLQTTEKPGRPAGRPGRGILMLRAAALGQPAPPGHPLRVLGGSDRELIDNASDQGSAPQALLLMNGVVDGEVLIPGSRLMRELAALPEGEARIDHLWLAALSRPPTTAERSRAGKELARGQAGLVDVAWALLNSDEFRIIP